MEHRNFVKRIRNFLFCLHVRAVIRNEYIECIMSFTRARLRGEKKKLFYYQESFLDKEMDSNIHCRNVLKNR